MRVIGAHPNNVCIMLISATQWKRDPFYSHSQLLITGAHQMGFPSPFNH
jgi:hypothetical protein